MTVHKKKEVKPEKKVEPVIISDMVTQISERVEVIEEVTPKAKQETAEEPLADPLSDFKEKMIEEEKSLPDNSPKKNYGLPILLVFVIAILLLMGVFLYKQGLNIGDKVNEVTVSPTPSITPEPTKTIDLAKYEIQILNGSGIDGEAGKQRNALEAEGFAIASVGNADNSDYTDTVIQTKKEVDKDFIAKLKTALESSFTIGETESLSEDSSVPVVVILGAKK